MEIRHLAHFLAVAEEQSFTRAAARVHVVQSALSLSIRNLERELGAPLFDRSTHHVVLTAAGEALVAEARKTLQAAEAARDAVAATVGGVRGTLRLGIMHSLAAIDLGGLLTQYHRTWPGVRIVPSAAAGGSAQLARDVRDGRLDLAFAAMPPAAYPTELTAIPLVREPLNLACPPDHPFGLRRRVALSELADKPFVDLPRGWGPRESVDRLFLAHGLSRDIAVEIPDVWAVSELVQAGFGFAFLSPSLTGPSPRVALVLVQPFAEFSVSLIVPANRPTLAAAQKLVELTVKAYPQSRQGLPDGTQTSAIPGRALHSRFSSRRLAGCGRRSPRHPAADAFASPGLSPGMVTSWPLT